MKEILQSESPCVECGAPKMNKEYKLVSEVTDNYTVRYERYIKNDCKKCGYYHGQLL